MKDWKKYTKLLLTAAAASVVMFAAPATARAMDEIVELDENNVWTDNYGVEYTFTLSRSGATLSSVNDENAHEGYSVDLPKGVSAEGNDYPVNGLGSGAFVNKNKDSKCGSVRYFYRVYCRKKNYGDEWIWCR